ncbi:hypothetical protein [Pelistega ratti]|uniref:hypothetical protein n=1 Tax=Pelistega ratti TaxID=2652177 RepID=UPI0019546C9E|nr:hypothetical protein [Pelistega ratti]
MMDKTETTKEDKFPLNFKGNIRFEQVKGVGTIDLTTIHPKQRVYTFIGENGIGKTKLLESLFSVLFLNNKVVKE